MSGTYELRATLSRADAEFLYAWVRAAANQGEPFINLGVRIPCSDEVADALRAALAAGAAVVPGTALDLLGQTEHRSGSHDGGSGPSFPGR